MGQASGGMTNESERFCPCMIDENYKHNEDSKWIYCHGCKNWFHTHCVLLSDIEYEEIMIKKEDWFCHDFKCQERKLENFQLNECTNVKHNDRSHLNRNCKLNIVTFEDIDKDDVVENIVQINDAINGSEDLVPCLLCNDKKRYKIKGGLKIHCRRKHKNENYSFMFPQEVQNKTNPKNADKSKQTPTITQIDFDDEDFLEIDGQIECKLCPGKFFQIPNGIKIHMTRYHPDFEKNCSKSQFEKLLAKSLKEFQEEHVHQLLKS